MNKPALRKGVRLTYDKTRQTHVLLFPEGVLVPNPTAVAVLELCDGESTVADITERLRARYAGVLEQDVTDILTRLADRRVLEGYSQVDPARVGRRSARVIDGGHSGERDDCIGE